jgi:hypothetical protein
MKKMANKRLWLGMLVMALVFGMTVAGCGGTFEAYVQIQNDTTFRVTRVELNDYGSSQNHDTSGINPGTTRTYEVNGFFHGTIDLTVDVSGTETPVTNSLTIPNSSGITIKYVLSESGGNFQLDKI